MIYTDPELIRVPTSADTQTIDILLAQLSSSVPPFSRVNLEATDDPVKGSLHRSLIALTDGG
jgi:hypothetical protein